MSTPLSTSTSYCSGADFVKRVDVRSIGDRLKDDGTRVAAGSVPSDPNLAVLLLQASGMIEESCLRGGRYTPTELSALTGASKERLIGLTADLTLWLIYNRRPDPERPVPPQCQMALQTLEALNQGLRIFGFQEEADAGKEIQVWSSAGQVSPLTSPPLLFDRAIRIFGPRNT